LPLFVSGEELVIFDPFFHGGFSHGFFALICLFIAYCFYLVFVTCFLSLVSYSAGFVFIFDRETYSDSSA